MSEAAKPRRRWVRRLVVAGVLALTLPVVAVAALLGTNPGLRVVRWGAERAANQALRGKVEIGAITGSAFSTLVITDLRVTDRDGREAVTLARLQATWHPLSVFGGAIEVSEVALTRPTVQLVRSSSGALNLAELVPPSPPAPEAPPGPLSLPHLEVGRLVIEDGALSFQDGEASPQRVDGLHLDVGATLGGDRVQADLRDLSALLLSEHRLRVAAKGGLEGAQAVLTGLRVDLDDVRLRAPHLATGLPPGAVDGALTVTAPPGAAARLGAPPDLVGGLELSLRAARRDGSAGPSPQASGARSGAEPRGEGWDGSAGPGPQASGARSGAEPRGEGWDGSAGPGPQALFTVTATGALSGAPLTLTATASGQGLLPLERLQVALHLRDLEPHRVHRAAPAGRLDVDLEATAGLADLARPQVQADLRLQGTVQPPGVPPVPLAPLAVQAELTGDVATVEARGRLGDARLDLAARVAALFGGAPVIREARVDLRVPELEKVAGDLAAGAVTLTATASGPLTALEAEGHLEGRRLAFAGHTRVSALEADWDLEGLPSAPVGHAAAHVGATVVAGVPLGGAELVLAARPTAGGAVVEVQDLLLRTGALVWRGDGARATLAADGGVRVEALGLSGPAGALRLDADIDPRGDVKAQVGLQALDLSALPREVVPALGEARGRLDLEAELARQGHTLEAKLEGRARGLALAPARPTVDAAFTVDLTPARLTTTASVSGPEVGAVTLRHQGRPPARMDSGPAWQASLHDGLLEQLTVDLHQLSLASAQAAVGQPLVATGEVDGQLQVDGSRTRAWVMGRSLRINKADAPQASLRIDAGHDPGRAFARAALDGAPFGTGTVSATISAPRELLDAPGWAGVDHRAVQALRADLSGLDLSLLARLGLAPEFEGLATARLVARDHLHALDADVTVERVRVPQVPGEWSAESRARLVPTPGGAPGEGDLTLALDLRRNARAVAHLAARAPLPLDRIIQAPALAQDIPLEADAQIEALPLPALAQAAGVAPTMMQGALTASVAVAGTARAPRGQAVVRLDDLVLGETRFPRARLDARLRGRRVAARLSLEDQAGGALDADAEAGLDPGPVQANLRATGLELGAVSRMGLLPVGMDGRLFADVHVQGPPAELWPEGWAEVRELRLVFSQAALQPVREGLARLELGPRTARVTMSGGSGGGKLDFSADANVPVEAPVTFTAKAKMQKYPVAAGGSLVRVDLEANAEGKRGADGANVQVRLQDGFVHVPEEKAEDLHPIEAPEDVVYVDTLPGGKGRTRARTSSVAAGPPTVVHIETVAPIDVRGGPVDAALKVELDAKAAGGKSALTGRVLTTDGALTLFRRRYIIERAQLIFDGQDPPDPRVSVRLRHDFPTLTFTVMVEGTANQPEVSFDASPSRYSQGELLSIFLGTDPEDLGKKDDRSVSQQAVGAVAGLLVGRLQEQLGQALPIDTLDVELGDTTTGAGTRVTLGKWITRKLFLAYRYKFQADTQVENDSEAVVQYRFLPGWMVEVILGLVRNDAELVWMKRF